MMLTVVVYINRMYRLSTCAWTLIPSQEVYRQIYGRWETTWSGILILNNSLLPIANTAMLKTTS